MKILYLFLSLMISGAISLSAEDVTTKKEISLFQLGSNLSTFPQELLSGAQANIRSAFINLGRFSVSGYSYTLYQANLEDFIQQIQSFKEATSTLPTSVQLGEAQFTYADYQKMVGGFILVLPEVVAYNEEMVILKKKVAEKSKDATELESKSDSKSDSDSDSKPVTDEEQEEILEYIYEVSIDFTLTFINVAERKALAQISLRVDGKNASLQLARREALDEIQWSLAAKLRAQPLFQLKTGIIEIQKDGSVVLELGSNMGILPGYEFRIKASDSKGFGFDQDGDGLLIVKRVSEEFSEGQVIYGKPLVGGALNEIPMSGFSTEFYYLMGPRIDIAQLQKPLTFSSQGGLKAKETLGSFGFYNYISFEYEFYPDSTIKPIALYFGGEWVAMLGRLEAITSFSLGAVMSVDQSDSLETAITLSHFGPKLDLALNWLFTDNLRLGIQGGARYMFKGIEIAGASSSFYNPYLQPYGGLNLILRL